MNDEQPARLARLERTDGLRGSRRSTVLRVLLGSLLAFGALNAFGGGVYGLAGARGVPTEWLNGSPFEDYFVPSLVLLIIVGGSLLLAAASVFARAAAARGLSLAAGVILTIWIAVQVGIIGYVSWLQPAIALAAAVILGLGSALPKRTTTGLRRGPSLGTY